MTRYTRLLTICALLSILNCFVAIGSNPDPSNKFKFGDGTASSKTIEFNRGGTNRKVLWNESSSSIDETADILRMGDGTSGSNKVFAANTAAANKPQIRYNVSLSRWEISDDGTTFFPFSALFHTSGYEPEMWSQHGGASVENDIEPHIVRAENAKTITTIVVCATFIDTVSSMTARVNYGPSLASSTSVTLSPGATGFQCTSSSPAISLSTNDLKNVDVTAVAGVVTNPSIRLLF